MNTFIVTFELLYPTSLTDIRDAYVLAKSFAEAHQKVEKKYSGEYERVSVMFIKKVSGDIIV